MAQSTGEPANAAADGEIREYKIHASTKYMELTRQKLELARLPREIPDANSRTWWNPKPTLEPLIDYWLEHFRWKEHEREINQTVPQFKISFQISATEGPTRIHFIHARSRHPNAVPLLLIPPFPFSNLSFRHVTDVFTSPSDATADQPFHLVMPSLPGVGFSDSLPDGTPVIPKTSEMFDTLMKRLGYGHYLATNSGSSITPDGGVDWKVINHLAATYPNSCLGVHLISPSLKAPKALKSPVEWMKLTLAKTLQTPIGGYTREDIAALQKNEREGPKKSSATEFLPLGPFGAGAYDPNTLAFALCDSPTGLLVFFLAVFRALDSEKEYTNLELVTTTKLTWLPGPEGTLRLLADSYLSGEDAIPKPSRKPKASITVFLADDGAGPNGSSSAQQSATSRSASPYACPSWGRQHYDVVWTGRARGKQGLLAWERPQVIADGARNLAKALMAVDKRLQAPVNGTA